MYNIMILNLSREVYIFISRAIFMTYHGLCFVLCNKFSIHSSWGIIVDKILDNETPMDQLVILAPVPTV